MMELPVIAAALVLFCAAGCESHSHGSDQYESREDPSQRMRIATKATDRNSLNMHVPHRFGIFMRKMNDARKMQHLSVPELQVGCGEGFVEFKPRTENADRKANGKSFRRKRELVEFESDEDEADTRTKSEDAMKSRMFDGGTGFPNFNPWKPQVYQIGKPYFIPVWGAPGKIPIYFPAQPLILNRGYPVRSPGKSYLPPKGYLPPKDKVDLANRYDGEAPVWDSEPQAGVTQQPTTAAPPTRRTRRPGFRRTPPPLIRRPDPNEINNNTVINSLSSSEFALSAQPAPRPVFAPPPPPPQSTVASPTPTPSRCVWAIISCCSAFSGDVSYGCFEQLGCTGPFWDASPCESDFARAAIATAMKYYES